MPPGDGPSEYLRSKGDGEADRYRPPCSELEITVFRPSVIFGPDDAFLNMFAKLSGCSRSCRLAAVRRASSRSMSATWRKRFATASATAASLARLTISVARRSTALRELVEYTAQLVGKPRRIIDLGNGGWAYLQAGLLWLLPNPPMSPDNLRSMDVDSVSDGTHDYPGWHPTALEAVAPAICRRPRLSSFASTAIAYRAGR
jgi:hypothetical protein